MLIIRGKILQPTSPIGHRLLNDSRAGRDRRPRPPAAMSAARTGGRVLQDQLVVHGVRAGLLRSRARATWMRSTPSTTRRGSG